MPVTLVNQTLIQPVAGAAFVPFEMYVIVAIVALICFFGSIWIQRMMIVTASLSDILFLALAWLTPSVGFSGTLATGSETGSMLIPWIYAPFDPYLVWIWMAFFFVGLINIFWITYRAWMQSIESKQKTQEYDDMMYRQEHQRRVGLR